MKKTMHAINLGKNQIQEFESFIALINDLVDRLNASKTAVRDFVENCKFCLELRNKRKSFTTHIKYTRLQFPSMSEVKQAELELFYFKGLKELESLLPSAQSEIKRDFLFPLDLVLLRELKIVYNIISDLQSYMATSLYPDRSQEIHANPQLMADIHETWADVDDY